MRFGAIEAGGTKWVCAIGSGPEAIDALTTIPTTTPKETIEQAAEFLLSRGRLNAVGVGSFGPLDLDRNSAHCGYITTTPKPGWADTPLVPMLAERLQAPVALDTDVNAAALGEHRFGAGRGLGSCCYLTIGTGIGGGVIANNALIHGLIHPEIGHLRLPHDRVEDPFAGVCRFHGDCFEGLASGEAMRARWSAPAPKITSDQAWQLEARYIAFGVHNIVCALSPQRVIIGGGVMKHDGLLELVRERFIEVAAGFLATSQIAEQVDEFVVAPSLGDRSGVIGALELARDAGSSD